MKLYIGGISAEVTEKDLQDLYSQYGKIKKLDLLKDNETHENRGYAFIEFEEDSDGEAAILGTNNTLLGSNNIQVSVSRSRLDQKRARQGKKRFNNNNNKGKRNFNNNRNNESQPQVGNNRNFNQSHNNNRFHNNQNLQKGVDYGRGPQTSFLGQENFGASARTMDTYNQQPYQGNSKYGKKNFRPRRNNNNNQNNQDNYNNKNYANKDFLNDLHI